MDMISFSDSSSTLFEFSPKNVGHSSSGRSRNGGPLIQVFTSSSGTPLVNTSAGLTSDLMYLNACVSRVSWISATLTETNGLNLLGDVFIQANTVCESIQISVLVSDNTGNSSASLQVLNNLESVRHPINSNSGIVFFFSGERTPSPWAGHRSNCRSQVSI